MLNTDTKVWSYIFIKHTLFYNHKNNLTLKYVLSETWFLGIETDRKKLLYFISVKTLLFSWIKKLYLIYIFIILNITLYLLHQSRMFRLHWRYLEKSCAHATYKFYQQNITYRSYISNTNTLCILYSINLSIYKHTLFYTEWKECGFN